MNKFFFYLMAAVAVLAVVFCVFELTQGDDVESTESSESSKAQSRRIKTDKNRAKREKQARRQHKKREQAGERVAVKIDEEAHEKPDFSLDAEDEAKLTEEMRQLYRDIQAALDENKQKKVIALVQKLQSMKEWPDGVPTAVKLRALEALSWFGASGMTEAVGFLGDADPEVVESAVEKFDTMLSESDLGDRATSEILKQIVQVVHDRDALDTFLNEMNNMRNSVRADTAIAVFDSGNDDAIAVLNENIDFLFCDNQADYEVKTRADVENYVQDNPDGEDDEEFYGPPQVE